MFDQDMCVSIGAAYMRDLAQGVVKIIGPSVIGTDDRAAQLFGGVEQYHTAMAADILKHINIATMVANQKQWKSRKVDWFYTAWLSNLLKPAAAQLLRNKVFC